MVWRDGFEIGFAGQVSAQAGVSVFDAAFLPWGMGIAEVGLQAERVEVEVACELGAVVEGEGPAQMRGQEFEPMLEQGSDRLGGFAVGSACEQDSRRSLVQGEDVVLVFGEAEEVGFPMTWLGSIEGGGIALVHANTAFDEACRAAAALATTSALAFGAREEQPPGEVLGAGDLGVDEAVDGLMGDAVLGFVAEHSSGDLLGRVAAGQLIEDGGLEVWLSGELGAGPASRPGLLVCVGRLVADFSAGVALQLASDRRWRAIQTCRDFPDRLAGLVTAGNLAPVLQ